VGDLSGHLSNPVAGSRPRTNSIDPARSAQCRWERGVVGGIRVRSYRRELFSGTSFAVSYGSVVKRGVGGGRSDVGFVDDRRMTRRLSAG